jgi:LacI family transcriptional regulator
MSTKTIMHIAKGAGVSIATVSRAIRGKEGVGKETRAKIVQIAERVHYSPNLQARGLASNKLDAIEIIIPRTSEYAFSNPYYAEILKGISKKAKERGQILILSISEEADYARIYDHRLAAGLIVLANRCDDPWIVKAWQRKIPLMLIPGDLNNPKIPSVDSDSVGGAFAAVEHLIGLGHRRIAFINGVMNSKYSIERLAGYRRALEKHSIPIQESLIVGSQFNPETAYLGMKKLLSFPKPPTAVLVINDYSAIGAMRAAKEEGYRIPEDISLIGFGDVPFSSMTDPPLTTVHESFQEMGLQVTERLLQIIVGKKLNKRHLVFPAGLVIRKSTASPR